MLWLDRLGFASGGDHFGAHRTVIVAVTEFGGDVRASGEAQHREVGEAGQGGVESAVPTACVRSRAPSSFGESLACVVGILPVFVPLSVWHYRRMS